MDELSIWLASLFWFPVGQWLARRLWFFLWLSGPLFLMDCSMAWRRLRSLVCYMPFGSLQFCGLLRCFGSLTLIGLPAGFGALIFYGLLFHVGTR